MLKKVAGNAQESFAEAHALAMKVHELGGGGLPPNEG
jgi:hypothetical protein